MKKVFLFLFILLITAVIAAPAHAGMSVDERTSDAQAIVDLYEHRYAPTPWKSEYLGIDAAALAERFLTAVSGDITDEEFYTAVARYVSGFKDAHVQQITPSSYRTTLGFEADDVDGTVIVTHIYRDVLPQEIFPFAVGDRVVDIDGVSVDVLRDELALIYTTGSDRADERINAMNLPWREQALFPIVPEGISSVTIAPQGESVPTTVNLAWIPMGMPLAPTVSQLDASKAVSIKPSLPQGPLDRLRSIRATFRKPYRAQGQLGSYPTFPLWSTFKRIEDAPLFAGKATFRNKTVGFIRIGSFYDADVVRNDILTFLAREIPKFEDFTDAMIIDLTSNDGGFICYAENIASFFIRSGIDALRFRIKPTRTWAVEFENALEWTFDEQDRGIIAQAIDEIRGSLTSGATLTSPLPICSADGVVPSAGDMGIISKTYSKPILILVDELNASAGEMFPAMFQDAGRAKVFGVRTMGAGGNVVAVGPIGNSDITVSVTESLVWRSKEITAPNGTRTHYIENVGVIPDFEYGITLEDYLGDYSAYRTAIEDAVMKTIN